MAVCFCFRQNQVVLLDTLEQEISKFKECHSMLDINALVSMIWGFPRWLSGKKSPADAGATGDVGSVPVSGGSIGGGIGNPLQNSCLNNPVDRGP